MIKLLKAVCSIVQALGGCEVAAEEILPTSTKEISYQAKDVFLRERFPNVPLFLTYQYLLPSYNDIAYFLARDQTNKYGYSFPDYLCSHYAMSLAGQFSTPEWGKVTFGLVWTDKHALNCVVTENLEFYFVEPQTDELQTELKEWQGTKLRFIMI